MALALYRKYRPQTFADVIGQDHVTEPLRQALRSGRLHHAYLFSGPRGCGKTTSARILARSINCAKGPTPEPCGECESCRALAPDGPGSIDVIEIDAASHGGVDDARELRERAFFAPAASRFKVYVIDEAHMVSTQGFNALLKLVEEPPEYVTFIFATTEPEKVLGTIKSRTHHYPFRLIPPGVLRPYLEKLCRAEGVSVEPAVFPLVVRAGGGSVRDSLSVLDQLIAGAGESGVNYPSAVALLGVTDVALIDEMADALAAGDGAAAFATVDRVAEAGHDARRFAADLLERLRDLIVLQQVPDAAANGIIDAPADQLERMVAQSARMGPATLSRLADIIHNGLIEMRGTTAPRLLLELIVARMLLPGADDGTGALLQRLERMERRLGAADAVRAEEQNSPALPLVVEESSRPVSAPPRPVPRSLREEPGTGSAPPQPGSAPPQPVSAPPVAPVRSDEAADPSPPGRLDAAAVRRVWDEVLTMVRRKSQRAWAVVREATVREVEGDTLVLVFRHAVHATMLSGSPELLVDAVGEVLGGTWQIRCELSGDQASGGTRAAAPGARPAPAAPAAAVPAAAPPASDWPTPARPGGDSDEADPAPAKAAGRGGGRGSGSSGGGGRSKGAATKSGGRGGARGPSAAGSTGTSSAGTTPSGARGPAGDAVRGDGNGWNEAWNDVEVPPGFDEFDPGDEPLDDASATRRTSEEQALQLLTEKLGAEKIGES